MTTPGIVVEGVWKKFRRGELHDSLRDLIPALARRAIGRPSANVADANGLTGKEFWALRDVNFTVGPGEVLGVIGANGAGKSTLLKTLNRILQPTHGRCVVRGRAGVLIEVSAGFHPDLTGRQNVFLQGAIMGMKARDIARKFDQIVEFSGIADFIETPVKRYSSGMNARLGFSIAAHLDPDVLLIDEVLAVGDLAFQDKAFGRVQEMAASGIPIVIVSHQLERIATLSSRVILLEKGRVVEDGTAQDVIASYVTATSSTRAGGTIVGQQSPAHLERLDICSPTPVPSGEKVLIRLHGTVDPGVDTSTVDPFHIKVRSAQTGRVVFSTMGVNYDVGCPPAGQFVAEIELQMNVSPGIYTIETLVHDFGRKKDVARGPMAHVQVGISRVFSGPIQLNPVITVGTGDATRTAAGAAPAVVG